MKVLVPKNGLQIGVLVAMLVVLLVAGYASWKQFERHSRIKAEVEVLEREKERVRKENESLKERIHYFSTESFQEQESKERLNMRKDREYVVDIERIQKDSEKEGGAESYTPKQEESVPNYKKWWDKIF